MFNVVITGADVAAAELFTMGAVYATREAQIVAHYGAIYQAAVRAGASGRPGPRAITGDYRRSIGLDVRRAPSGTVAMVSSNAPQARRLEFGFVGTDSLGRRYNQAPLPHWEPPLERVANLMHGALWAAVPA